MRFDLKTIAGHEPDMLEARQGADHINKAMETLRRLAPDSGSYVSESNFFESGWQQSFWGHQSWNYYLNHSLFVKHFDRWDSW